MAGVSSKRAMIGRVRFRAALLGLACLLSWWMASTARSAEPEVHATGLFLNEAGDVLTARHAVEKCKALYVVKNGRIEQAWLRAMAPDADLAVLKTRLKPSLSVTFPIEAFEETTPKPVFAEAYAVLQEMPDRSRAMFNAVTVPGNGHFSMMSPVRPGASGSAVLGADGRVLGMVVERTANARSSRGTRSLSRYSTNHLPQGAATEVGAVAYEEIKRFLRDNAVVFHESSQAQLGPGQASAPRAATLSVGVICA